MGPGACGATVLFCAVFFVDCESGSGAFWTCGTFRWVLPGRVSGGAGRLGVRDGFGLGV